MKLTKLAIDKAQCPEEGQVFLRDETFPGFGVRLTKGGKTFILEKRIGGRNRRMVIGPYGPLTVDQAKDEARKLIGRIVSGEDPAEEKAEKRAEATFKEFAGRFLEHVKRINAEGTHENYYYMIERDLIPEWGTRKLTAIKRADVQALHARIGSTRPYQANRTLSLIGRMFSLAALWGDVPEGHTNPARGIQKFMEYARDRWIKPEELPKLAAAINKNPNPFIKAALWLYMLTGCRRNELLSAKWADVDFDRRELRLPKTKAHRTHYIPLSDPAMRILEALPRFEDNPYIFPGRAYGQHLKGIKRHWQKVREAAGLTDLHLHDLRRTLGSWLATSGESLNLIGKILNHSI